MRYWTWGEIKEKIENEFDLKEEPDILAEGELLGYLNDAIDACEQHFIKLGDYFYSISDPVTIVAGTKDYDLPEDIYATKIRQIICDGEYEIKRLKDIKNIPQLTQEPGSSYYKYKLINNPGSRPKIRLFPTPTSGGSLEIHYTRNAYRVNDEDGDDQEVDIPEAMLFIMEFIRMRVYEKEKQLQNVSDCKERLLKFEQMLIDALDAEVDDEDNTIEPDVEIYQDMVGSYDV
jgi:hypothetical protein